MKDRNEWRERGSGISVLVARQDDDDDDDSRLNSSLLYTVVIISINNISISYLINFKYILNI